MSDWVPVQECEYSNTSCYKRDQLTLYIPTRKYTNKQKAEMKDFLRTWQNIKELNG